ncbi:MAG: tRNA lysidine(34) synthetase TilS [Deltaproteobacteria bacterium]|nr:tRNA lysidine(34) synthetase TilS [Deltaproteobacteria bacterium]
MKLKTSRHAATPGARPGDEMEAIFDLAGLPERLTVRNFRAGDRFRPLGMHGRKKVKDLFIEKRVPRSLRSTLPLLAAGEEILWIPRCGRSGVAAVGPATREVLRIELVPGREQAPGCQY